MSENTAAAAVELLQEEEEEEERRGEKRARGTRDDFENGKRSRKRRAPLPTKDVRKRKGDVEGESERQGKVDLSHESCISGGRHRSHETSLSAKGSWHVLSSASVHTIQSDTRTCMQKGRRKGKALEHDLHTR